jgi:hypothetical protein
MTAETAICLTFMVFAASLVALVWIVLDITRAPIMELHCPRCGVVHGCDDGKCLRCGMGVQLWDRKGGG